MLLACVKGSQAVSIQSLQCVVLRKIKRRNGEGWLLSLSCIGWQDSLTSNKSRWMLTCGILTADKVVVQPREIAEWTGRGHFLGGSALLLAASQFPGTTTFITESQGGSIGVPWNPHAGLSCDNKNGCLNQLIQLAFLQLVCGTGPEATNVGPSSTVRLWKWKTTCEYDKAGR